jgi:hypothetical protein
MKVADGEAGDGRGFSGISLSAIASRVLEERYLRRGKRGERRQRLGKMLLDHTSLRVMWSGNVLIVQIC